MNDPRDERRFLEFLQSFAATPSVFFGPPVPHQGPERARRMVTACERARRRRRAKAARRSRRRNRR